jgi:hypothetical protein
VTLYHLLAFQSETAQSDKPKCNRELSNWKTKFTLTVVILCEMGGSDSGVSAAAAAEPKPHLLAYNAVSLSEQFQKKIEGSECLLVPVDESSKIPPNGRHCSTVHPMTECHIDATTIFNNPA